MTGHSRRDPVPRPAALDPGTVAALKDHKDLLPRLREAVASGAGIEVPKLAEVKRVSWANLLFAVGSLIGIWAIIGVLSGAGDSLEAIRGASWGWVALTFLFAQLPVVADAPAHHPRHPPDWGRGGGSHCRARLSGALS
jgi:hypothetical protein